ncbi:MAG: PHP domain-containing protein [candidate division Zixibacteria bacterium]|nr:PHP domain-containing protein [candidate division Zixibacteria bacterium]
MLIDYKADLHIHTCLSPCAEVKMSPATIVKRAKAIGVHILGISDHNSAENTPAALKAAHKYGVHVLPSMEVTSSEEVHILALFDALEPVQQLQEIVYQHLPGENDEETFGMQVIANADDEVLGFNKKLLIGATTLTVEEIVNKTRSLGGLAVAAHIDRGSFSLISQLGFIPDNLALDALEISPALSYEDAMRRYSPVLPLIYSSDAHKEEDIGQCCTHFLIDEVNIGEIRKALSGQEGRKILR